VTAALDAFAADAGGADAGPVTVVGGRTQWAVGGALADGAREVRAPAGVVELVPAEMTVRVRTGTTVADLDAALAEAGQTVALPDWPGATVGGVLAVGRSGVRRLGWGPVRDTVLEARFVTAEGRLAKAGGPTVKNVSGYDLCRLLVGSLGTVGLLAEVVLRTRPLPAASRWLRGAAVDPFAVVRTLYRPNAVLWDGKTTWALLEGHAADVDAQADLAGSLGLTPCPPGGRPDLGALPHRRSLGPHELAGAVLGPVGSYVAEIGVGVVHQAGPPAPRPLPPPLAALHRRVKATFDPGGRLNPGRDPAAA
jgi:glycolate oxidase FAD binding subunit